MDAKKHHLRKKGWSEEEIAHATGILRKAEAKKHPSLKKLDKLVFWLMLFLVLLGIYLMTTFLLPMLIIIPSDGILLLIALLGAALGVLFVSSSFALEHQWHHHVLNIITIPLITIIGFVAVTNKATTLSQEIARPVIHNAYLVGVVFSACFLLPYIIMIVIKHRNRKVMEHAAR